MGPREAGYTGTRSTWTPGRRGQGPEVVGIGGEDLVAVGGQEDEGGIDDVGRTRPSEEDTRPPAQTVVERGDLDAGQDDGEQCLAVPAPPPHLPDDTAVGEGRTPGQNLILEGGDEFAVGRLDRDQGPRIEKEGHESGPRTTMARAPRPRRASRISSSVITPCSAS